jgi:hypothetical protein
MPKKVTVKTNINQLFSWEVERTMKSGETVYMLDMLEVETKCLNNMVTEVFYQLLAAIEKEDAEGRFVFWTIKETTEVTEEQNEAV